MPLRDHFRPPVLDLLPWRSFFCAWLNGVADKIVEQLPHDYHVEQSIKPAVDSSVDVMIATADEGPGSPWRSVWQPPPPRLVVPTVYPDRYEIQVFRQFGGRQLVAAVEFVSPGNKSHGEYHEAFASKVAGYLHEGVCVLVIDVVTEPCSNLHDELMRTLGYPANHYLAPGADLYAATYRPVIREKTPQIDVWPATFSVGNPLPTMPLRLIADYFVPVELELTYTEACRRRRLI